MLGRWETPYLKARINFVGDFSKDTPVARKESSENLENFRDSIILKNMELAYGAFAANAVLTHISHTVCTSRKDILSDFEIFSKYVIQVYGELEGRKFLSKIPKTH